jgi:DNA-binding response OmpR family regulator
MCTAGTHASTAAQTTHLPLADRAATKKAEEPSMMRPRSQVTGMVVLIVDPDPASRDQIAACLTSRFRVIQASNGDEALRQINLQHPAIVLMELDQPDSDGFRLIEAIRRQGGRDMIISCLTRRNSVPDKISSFKAGADDYVVKPVNTETFYYHVVLLARSLPMRWSSTP